MTTNTLKPMTNNEQVIWIETSKELPKLNKLYWITNGKDFERLFFIEITRYKPHSRIVRGYAMGYYGTQILKNEKLYFQYKTNGKFKKFVDSWHPILFPKGDK